MESSLRKKPNSGANTFPDDLVFELLIRLPGKQVARCKCVCKSWRSVIKSAHFRDVYGTRQRGLILHRFEPGFRSVLLQVSIYYSPVRGLKEAGPEEFNCLNKFRFFGYFCMTQIVNGLVCIYHPNAGLYIHNVYTGERMVLPDLLLPNNNERPAILYREEKRPAFHLGFDPATRKYKLLRLKLEHHDHVQAHVMTLRYSSSSSSSTWRELIVSKNMPCPWIVYDQTNEKRMSSNDGLLCWQWPRGTPFPKYLILFDFNKEKFHKILLPSKFLLGLSVSGDGFVRAHFMEHAQRLAVSLWCVSPMRSSMCLECFIMDDDEGQRWTSHSIDFPRELAQDKAVFVFPNGNLSDASVTEVVLIDTTKNDVYCLDHTSKMEVQFRVGKQPDLHPMIASIYSPGHPNYKKMISTFSCLFDANNLYLPIDDILK